MSNTAAPLASAPSTPEAALLHRGFTQAHATHQDGLVQAYRAQLWGFETVAAVCAAAGGLLAQSAGTPGKLVAAAGLLAGLWMHHRVTKAFTEAIAYRQHDVDWAQQQLMAAEACVSSDQRTFTRFKVYQDRDAATLAKKTEVFLSDDRKASLEDIVSYFYSHKSKSRAKSAYLLQTGHRLVQGVAVLSLGLMLI